MTSAQQAPSTPSNIEIRRVETSDDRKTFIRLANSIYADDPNFVAPLEFELADRMNAEKNPALKSSPHQLWVAYKDNRPVGRISAVANKSHLDHYNDAAGHFGFLDAEDDPAIFDALIQTASDWMRAQGLKKIQGPFNFSVNEEIGMLVDGFDTPPYVMMPHGRRYAPGHMERLGFTKAKDMHALEYYPVRDFIPTKRMRFIEKALAKPNVSIRTLAPGDLIGDVRIIIDIFNDAWSDNWGFIPFTEEHAQHMAAELKPIIQNHNVVICYYDGEPAAFGLVLPNINRAIKGFNGKLFPFNWAKLLYRLKVKGIDQSRMPLMGVRKSLHKKPVGAAFAYKIIEMVNSSNMDRGVTHSELSWILEDNDSMLTMLTDMGCKIYKTYRIYEKGL
ncbi:MAG: DNA-binding protein [Hyphococcus sp.]|nr:MAG: DNA-binding protein [Marinicaulis sp.]